MRTVTIKGTERVAINKTAALVTGIYQSYTPIINHNRVHYDTPPPSIPVPYNKINLLNSKRGNITIKSYLGDDKWLGKCVCGKYEVRNGEKWRRGLRKLIKDDGCIYCQRQLRKNGTIS